MTNFLALFPPSHTLSIGGATNTVTFISQLTEGQENCHGGWKAQARDDWELSGSVCTTPGVPDAHFLSGLRPPLYALTGLLHSCLKPQIRWKSSSSSFSSSPRKPTYGKELHNKYPSPRNKPYYRALLAITQWQLLLMFFRGEIPDLSINVKPSYFIISNGMYIFPLYTDQHM